MVKGEVTFRVAAALALLGVAALCVLAWQRKVPAHPPPIPQRIPEIPLHPLLFHLLLDGFDRPETLRLSWSFLPPIHLDSAAVDVELDGRPIATLNGRSLLDPPPVALPATSGSHRLSIRGRLYEGRLIEEEIIFLLPSQAPPGMVPVLDGAFLMGCQTGDADCSDTQDEMPLHRVAVDGFFLAAHETTRREYGECVAGGACSPAAESRNAADRDPDAPAIDLTWEQAQAYCAWRGGRLPTEAEWEFAAHTDVEKTLDEIAWYGDSTRRLPHRSGEKAPDARGIYDLLGNVWEWCADGYDPAYYGQTPPENPFNRAPGGQRVLRGGSWHDPALLLRPSNRAGLAGDHRGPDIGFRCARDFE